MNALRNKGSYYACLSACKCVRANVHVYFGHLLQFLRDEKHVLDDGKGKKIEKETQYSFTQASKVSCVYLGAACCS